MRLIIILFIILFSPRVIHKVNNKLLIKNTRNKMEQVKSYTQEDVEWLARNIYFEARGENLLGRMVVAFVTLNRVIDKRWPNTIKGVVTQRKQFSWYNAGTVPDIKNSKVYEKCKETAKMCIDLYNDMADADGYVDDGIVKGANHYYAAYIPAPSWVDSMEYLGKVGVHLLYKN